MHYPDSMEKYEQARRRMAFEELLCVQLAVLERRLAWQDGKRGADGLAGRAGGLPRDAAVRR